MELCIEVSGEEGKAVQASPPHPHLAKTVFFPYLLLPHPSSFTLTPLASSMNLLVIGSGGREHALCWKLRQSPLCRQLYCAPGNAGIADVATCVPLHHSDVPGIRLFCQNNAIDLVVIGPEGPLVAGLADVLRQDGVRVFGPGQGAAQLEGSKGFMKDLCARAGVPTARYRRCTTLAEAEAFLTTLTPPLVIKADGLAAGKGVFICDTLADAVAVCRDLIEDRVLGEAAQELVIEEFLKGFEVSFFALADGRDVLAFATAQDYKRAHDGDLGPNTGGMGGYSPAVLGAGTDSEAFSERVMETLIRPVVRELAAMGFAYQGVLYAGLMVAPDGTPKLLEFNVRFGDPECQLLMRRLAGDLVPLLLAVAEGRLREVQASWHPDPALTVVMASAGYPGAYKQPTLIASLPADTADTVIFHAGTERDFRDNALLAVGGRVLNVTATGTTLAEAQTRAYAAIARIDWRDGFCRSDIGRETRPAREGI
jgi:phosphoribosylamine---glycine ligase